MRQGGVVWITGDVDLPTQVVEALADDKLVLFVGAGASLNSPSDLPLFNELAEQIADLASEPFDGDIAADVFLGRLSERTSVFDVHRHAKEIVANVKSKPNRVHDALVRLAVTSSTPRIITTNYDDHLAQAAAAAGIDLHDRFNAPALPLGRSFGGLVHLHGTVNRSEKEFVLTDRDFGRAYLTDAWASRFLQQVFAEFTVLFVGYSHADLVMTYLAMGLRPGSRRYAFTDEPDDPRWTRLEITPIAYPPDNHHVALEEALVQWRKRSVMGYLDHRERIRDIVAGGPPKTPVDVDYLESTIETPAGARFFADFARGKQWLKWAEERESFKAAFRPGPIDSETTITLSAWFATHFMAVASETDGALATLQRLGQAVSDPLLRSLLFAVEELSRVDSDAAARWSLLLETSMSSSSLRSMVLEQFLYQSSSGAIADLPLLRRSLMPSLRLHQSFSWDGSVEPERPAVELAWPVDEYALTEAWIKLSGTLTSSPGALLLAFESTLLDAYELLEGYRGLSAWDELAFRRSAIEPHEQDSTRTQIDVVIDGLRDCADKLSGLERDALIEKWWASDRLLLRRIAVYLVAQS
jgi:hypothetical protein